MGRIEPENKDVNKAEYVWTLRDINEPWMIMNK